MRYFVSRLRNMGTVALPVLLLFFMFSFVAQTVDAQVAQESPDQSLYHMNGAGGATSEDTKVIPPHSVITGIAYGSDEQDGLFSASYGSFITSGPDKGKVKKEGTIYKICGDQRNGDPQALNSLREGGMSQGVFIDRFPNSPQSSFGTRDPGFPGNGAVSSTQGDGPLDYFLTSWGWTTSFSTGGTPRADGCSETNASNPANTCIYLDYQTYDPVTLQLTGSPTMRLPNGNEVGDCAAEGYTPSTVRGRLYAPPGKFIIGIEYFVVGRDASTAGIRGTRRSISGFNGPAPTPSFSVAATIDQQVLRDNGSGDGKNIAVYDLVVSNCQNLTGPVTFSAPVIGSITDVAVSFDGGKNTATCNPGDNIVTVRVVAGPNANPARGPSSGVINQMITTASSPGAASSQVPLGITIYGRPQLTLTGGNFSTTENAVIGWQTNYVYSSVNFHPPCDATGDWSGYKNGGDSASFTENLGILSAGTHTYTLTCPGALGTSVSGTATITISNAPRGTIEVNYSYDGVDQATAQSVTYSIVDTSNGNTIVGSAPRNVPNTSSVGFALNNTYQLLVTSPQTIGTYILDTNAIDPLVEPQADGTNKLIFTIGYRAQQAKDFGLEIVSVTPASAQIVHTGTVVVVVRPVNCIGGFGGPVQISAVDNDGNANFSPTNITLPNCNTNATFTYTGNNPGNKTMTFSGTGPGISGDRRVEQPVTIYGQPAVSLSANPPSGYAPLDVNINWTSQNIDASKPCELYADGVPTGERNAYYGHITNASGDWSGFGDLWSVTYSGTGSHGWTKEVTVNGETHRVHFQVSDQPQVFSVGSDPTNNRSWFTGGERAYFKINAGPAYANKEILWSTFNGGSTFGIADGAEQNLNYRSSGVVLDSNGRWEGYAPYGNPLSAEPNYDGWRTKQIKIVNPGGSPLNYLATYYISYQHTAAQPMFTMDKTYYRTNEAPLYTVKAATPNSKIYWGSYFNNYFYGNISGNGSTNSNAVNGGPLTQNDYAYAYRVKCYGYLGTFAERYRQVVLNPPASDINITYTLDGASAVAPASFDYHIDEVATGLTTYTGISAPANKRVSRAGQYTFVYDGGAPSGYTFDAITTPGTAYVASPGSVTFNVNFKSTFTGTLVTNVSNSTCNQIDVTWNALANPSQKYIIYRDGVIVANNLPHTTTSWSETISGGPFVYTVALVSASGTELTRDDAPPVSTTTCSPDFSGSDKQIVTVNGQNNTSLPADCNGVYGGLLVGGKSNVVKPNSTIDIRLDICNNGTVAVANTAANNYLQITDQLQNLVLVGGITCRRYNAGPNQNNCLVQGLSTSGTGGNQLYVLAIRGAGLPPGAYYQLRYTVRVSLPTGSAGKLQKVKNTVKVFYNGTGNPQPFSDTPVRIIPFPEIFVTVPAGYDPTKEEISP